MGNVIAFLFVVVFVLIKFAAKNAGKGSQSAAQRRAEMKASVERLRELSERTAEQRERTAGQNERTTARHEQAAERWRALSAQKREDAERSEQWRAAKRKQEDAEQLHAIHIDSCESKLESLRVLYDAGILDREEYAQRVARVKAKHGR